MEVKRKVFTLHLRFLSGISRVPSPYFGRVFTHKEEDRARFFTLHLRLLRGICGKTSCFCHDFAQNKGDCASSCVSFKVFFEAFYG